jgi:hypothetical protein
MAPFNVSYPSVLEYEIPAFLADSKYTTPAGQKFLDIPAAETVYAIWIGTNDVGNYAFLTDSQVAGKTLPDYIECVYEALDRVYENGGRYFVLMNLAPLQLTPQYALLERGGAKSVSWWPDKPENQTAISYRMWEQVITVNDVVKYKTPFEVLVKHRWPGARVAVMDMYGLVSCSFSFSSCLFFILSLWCVCVWCEKEIADFATASFLIFIIIRRSGLVRLVLMSRALSNTVIMRVRTVLACRMRRSTCGLMSCTRLSRQISSLLRSLLRLLGVRVSGRHIGEVVCRDPCSGLRLVS